MKRLIALCLLLAGCGGSSSGSADAGVSKEALRQQYEHECMIYCYHRLSCFQEVCSEDYPGSVTSFNTSVGADACLQEYCKTEKYVDWKLSKDGQEYLECTAVHSCREITTGVCGDTAHCTDKPDSVPHKMIYN